MGFRLGDWENGEEDERLKVETPGRDLETRELLAAVRVKGMINLEQYTQLFTKEKLK